MSWLSAILVTGLLPTLTIADDQKADSLPSGVLLRLGPGHNSADGHTQPLRSATFLPDGKSVLTRCDQKILRWDAATGKLLEKVEPPIQTSSFLTTNDGKWIVAASPNAILQVYDAASRKLHQSIQTGAGGGYTYGLASDSRTLVVLGRDIGTLSLFDLTTGEKKTDMPLPKASNREQYAGMLPRRLISTRHARLIGAGTEGHLTVWDITRGRQVRSIPFPEDRVLRHAALSGDGRLAAIDFYGGELTLWELSSGVMRLRLAPWVKSGRDYRQPTVRQEIDGLRYPMAVAFSSDGRLLARACEDHKVRLWDVWTGKEAGVLDGHRDHVSCVAFSPDGRRFATAGGDAIALIWDMNPIRSKLPTLTGPLDPSQWESTWTALADENGNKVTEAIRALAGDPKAAVAIFKDRVKPAPKPDDKQLAKLIAELDDAKFAVRQKAKRELEQLGEQAAPALLEAALNSASTEVRKAAQRILDGLGTRTLGAGEMRAIRAVEVLEMCGTSEAKSLLKALATGAPAATLTDEAKGALDRLDKRETPE
jgi:WD40 repeat protein